MDKLQEQIAGGLQQRFPRQVGQVRELVIKHPDTLWVVPLLSAAVFSLRALEDAKAKKVVGTMANTLGTVLALVSAANGIKLEAELKRRRSPAAISDDMKQRILAAIQAARAQEKI
ncbi:hypothetical protein A2634_00100 [Candidatus Amesbacteria bacterium RIFCSPHIGHO2_01_FULL_48_32]|uniref:Uncharacterized protein n=1 Tax=Candidatus Amesbacteria bacterium RIFCSPLOWO2_01_FULL_48_25 TaxID=1797259 RepID=A0A1F4ZA31_9BACT|nr:MAG: hypothetical protein A2634_00100 [Candidatus Amesbacteria bacterium RIFCSPHIGHO2_01_FULL_48_32]OGD03210.1 MAG: hypothetical protein A2989_00050 [Candidatus Amesbacteria bacterium RIFCSPLOWO2_01_FULL_48_25]HJZ05537.1 hypothetical protein [Patescibacteria group bacterium]